MGIHIKDLIQTIEQELEPWLFKDYAPNGLQVEGKPQIQKIVSGVTACEQLLDRAIAENADAILVHHGYFWRGEEQCILGMKKRRLKKLLIHDINLLAYHLPLDAHPVLGNNAELARKLGIKITGGLDPLSSHPVGNIGILSLPMTLDEAGIHIHNILGQKPLLIEGHQRPIKKIAWCSGGAQDYIEQAILRGADAYMSGEISERTVHTARECGIHFIAAGHHATERYGVQALGNWLMEKTAVAHQFIDIPNPA